jgi:membrane protein YqaA with SNARE-associated domain
LFKERSHECERGTQECVRHAYLSLPCLVLAHPTGVHGVLRHFLAWLLHLGVLGPLLLGIADSSFLFLPFGNDLLIVILTARDHAHLPFYVLTAAIGSTLGVVLLDVVCRKGGEEGLKKMMKPRRLEYFKRRMKNQAAIAIGLACLAPPPFPFTLVIASASAFAYPRQRLLALVFVARAARFTIVGLLAIRFGSDILRIAKAPETTWIMLGFILLCVIGSAFQIMQWARRSRRLA